MATSKIFTMNKKLFLLMGMAVMTILIVLSSRSIKRNIVIYDKAGLFILPKISPLAFLDKNTTLRPIKKNCSYLRNLATILLAVNFNFAHYAAIPKLNETYGPYFAKLVFCGPKKETVGGFDVIEIPGIGGYQGYGCLAKAIEKYPVGYQGYFHTNDDVILNLWNFNMDPDRVWIGKVFTLEQSHTFTNVRKTGNWWWWRPGTGIRGTECCEKGFNELTRLKSVELKENFDYYFKNTKGEKICIVGHSDVFYIPNRVANVYKMISDIYVRETVFLETAVPTILAFLGNINTFIDLDGVYYNDQYGYSEAYYSGQAFSETYNFNITFSHPFKLSKDFYMRINNEIFLPELKRRVVYCKNQTKNGTQSVGP